MNKYCTIYTVWIIAFVCLYVWIGSSIIVALILLFRNCAFQVEEHLIKYVYKFLYKNKSMNYAVQNSIIIDLRYLCLNYDEASYDNWYIQKFCLYLNKDFICSFFLIKKNLSVKNIKEKKTRHFLLSIFV